MCHILVSKKCQLQVHYLHDGMSAQHGSCAAMLACWHTDNKLCHYAVISFQMHPSKRVLGKRAANTTADRQQYTKHNRVIMQCLWVRLYRRGLNLSRCIEYIRQQRRLAAVRCQIEQNHVISCGDLPQFIPPFNQHVNISNQLMTANPIWIQAIHSSPLLLTVVLRSKRGSSWSIFEV